MSGLLLSQASHQLNGEFIGEDQVFHSVNTDTRSLQAGDLFVALRGPHYDAHKFIAEVQAKQALAVVVDHQLDTTLPQIIVKDTLKALGQLASIWREQFSIPVIAVTGSNGKTTVKEMLASILGQQGPVLATRGNFNNEVGVPLTLFGLDAKHLHAVIEMGASHAGDIEYLTHLARPTVAVITNAGPAHLEGFGDIEGVAHAKGEIFSGLSEQGIAVINADDEHKALWCEKAGGHQCVTFGIDHAADVMALDLKADNLMGSVFKLKTPVGDEDIVLRLAGGHNVINALAASAVAYSIGISLKDIKKGLELMMPVGGRLQIKNVMEGIRVIDDSYNANPASMQAALDVLVSLSGKDKKVLVLGDMGELGSASQSFHKQIGERAREIGVDQVFAIGDLGRITAGSFGEGAQHFKSHRDMISRICDELKVPHKENITVLVKGSRCMKMEQVVEVLVNKCDQSTVIREAGN